jgi:hypothetical protein
VPKETREYKNERYLEFKEKGWTKKLNKLKTVKIDPIPSIKQIMSEEKNESYEELKKNSMIQKQFEELTKTDEISDSNEDPEKHNRWLNKQLRKDGHDELENIPEKNDEPEVSEEMLRKIEDERLKEPLKI